MTVRNDRGMKCSECGSLLITAASEERECIKCGKKAVSNEVCENGHFICDSCLDGMVVDSIRDICMKSDSKDPIAIALKIMETDAVRMHGTKHHTLVSSCLLTAYKNCGGDIDLEAALKTADVRGSWFPGGICGFAGACGACASAGIFYSIVTKTTPRSGKTWSDTVMMNATCLTAVGSVTGPRCCKRNCFLAMQAATKYVKEKLGVEMETAKEVSCPYVKRNEDCILEACPFFRE